MYNYINSRNTVKNRANLAGCPAHLCENLEEKSRTSVSSDIKKTRIKVGKEREKNRTKTVHSRCRPTLKFVFEAFSIVCCEEIRAVLIFTAKLVA